MSSGVLPADNEHPRIAGRHGEEIAVEYLRGLGYQILERNFQTRHGELDCVARAPDGTLVFVEVKSSSTGRGWGHPFHRISRAKQRHLVAAAHRYRVARGETGACRFDVIAVVDGKVEHLKNAFWTG